ncbi:hypothetical protein PMAYCL1PPCAC_33290, partial [Pristionchus mayeri]
LHFSHTSRWGLQASMYCSLPSLNLRCQMLVGAGIFIERGPPFLTFMVMGFSWTAGRSASERTKRAERRRKRVC